jgi:hypothetical protein
MSPTSASFFVIFLGKKWLVPNKSDEFQVSLKITNPSSPPRNVFTTHDVYLQQLKQNVLESIATTIKLKYSVK